MIARQAPDLVDAMLRANAFPASGFRHAVAFSADEVRRAAALFGCVDSERRVRFQRVADVAVLRLRLGWRALWASTDADELCIVPIAGDA